MVAAILQAVEIEPTTPSCFIVISAEAAETIRAEIAHRRASGHARDFDSVRVTAIVGRSRWQTSVIPHKESRSFFLPIKAQVRRDEALVPGETVAATMMLEK